MSFFILLCFLIYHKSTRPSSSSQMRALSSPATTTQSITAIDSSGNLSSLSFPTGFILLWYPPDTTLTTLAQIAKIIPSGWAICDGTQKTPDLRGRFVLMAQDTTNGTNGSIPHTINQKGGEETHVLSQAEMPAHSHGYWDSVGGSRGNLNGNNNVLRTKEEINRIIRCRHTILLYML